MAKAAKTRYFCTECGSQQPKWAGQCPDCQAWNSMQEAVVERTPQSTRFAGYAGEKHRRIRPLSEIEVSETDRVTSGLPELDRVLGGGALSLVQSC